MVKPLFMCKGNGAVIIKVLSEIFRHNDEPVIKAEFHINGVKQNRVLSERF